MSRKYALFLGNSEYDSESLSDLESPISDVRDLANLFRDSAIGGFDEVVELINCVESEIRQAISGFFLKKKPEDLLLLYFSGHGVLDDRGHLYLAVKDTRPDLLRATAISADFIADDMDLCRSKRQILILDCCHSGAFRRGIKGSAKALTASTFEGNGSGRIVLTASDRREFAMEGNQVLEQSKTSLFTHFLLEGIKSGEADRDGDSFISLDEWYDYAYDKVVSKLPTQTPRRWVYNQEGRLIIARNPKPEKIKPAELSHQLQESIQDNRFSVRLRAVSELSEILDGNDKRLALAAHDALGALVKDDNAEVKKEARRVLADYNSPKTNTEPGIYVDPISFWNGLLTALQNRVFGQWRNWVVAIVLTGGVIFAVWKLYPLLIQGNLDTIPEESLNAQTLQNEEILPNQEDPPPKKQENNPTSKKETGFTNTDPAKEQQGDGDTNKNGTDSESPSFDPQQLPPQQSEDNNPVNPGGESTKEDVNKPEVQPIDRVRLEVTELEDRLIKAIIDRQWNGIPIPLSDYYEKRLDGFYSKFNILEVKSTVGEIRSGDATFTLPVTLDISYKQKGREDIKNLPISANWIFEKEEKEYVLRYVRPPE